MTEIKKVKLTNLAVIVLNGFCATVNPKDAELEDPSGLRTPAVYECHRLDTILDILISSIKDYNEAIERLNVTYAETSNKSQDDEKATKGIDNDLATAKEKLGLELIELEFKSLEVEYITHLLDNVFTRSAYINEGLEQHGFIGRSNIKFYVELRNAFRN